MWPQLFQLALEPARSFPSIDTNHSTRTHVMRTGFWLCSLLSSVPRTLSAGRGDSVQCCQLIVDSVADQRHDLSAMPSLRVSCIACVCPDRGHQTSVLTVGCTAGGIPHCVNFALWRHQSVGDGHRRHRDILRVIQRLLPGLPTHTGVHLL